VTTSKDSDPPEDDRGGIGEPAAPATASTGPGAAIAARDKRIQDLADELRRTKAELRRAERETAGLRRDLAALRNRRAVRLVVRLSGVAGRQARRAGRIAGRLRRLPGREARPEGWIRVRATRAEEKAFAARLEGALRPARTEGPLVTVLVGPGAGLDPRRLLRALGEAAYRPLEVVLCDTGGPSAGPVPGMAEARLTTWPFPVRVVDADPDTAQGPGVARAAAIADARGELLLLLRGDLVPAGPHVIGHLVDRLLADEQTGAVGARLIHARRHGPGFAPAETPGDLLLAHRGTWFATRGGAPIATSVGEGEDPLGDPASESAVVPAASGCLLVRRHAWLDVGDAAADDETAAIDGCLRLRAAGLHVAYEPQATFFDHAPDGPPAPERRIADDAWLRDAWGADLFREILLDRLRGARAWAAETLHVGITLTKDDPDAGYGDWHTGHELGDALTALGWRITYLERQRDAWYTVAPDLDVVIALLDAFDIRRLPDGVVRVAWVRNWTDRWLRQPWFDEFDLVFASSTRSAQLIADGSVHVPQLMPIATNPDRFQPRSIAPEAQSRPAVDVLFSGNRWGEPRAVENVLVRLAAAGRRVRILGGGWDGLALEGTEGRVPYDALPGAYAGTAIVLDDAASPTGPYGSMNSRVFDALATGTLVVTDNVLGAKELFDGQLPAADSDEGVVALVERYLSDPVARETLAGVLQARVLAEHTYGRRAGQLRDALVAWARAPHVDIAAGPPSHEVAPQWGDYHFGRAFQRALQRRGLRTRLRLLPDWEGPAAGRADVAVHLFGRSERRRRPSQVSALWVISHPDLVTDELLTGQDLALVASDAFAETLRGRAACPVHAFHQATDEARFRPRPGGPAHELLFVGNSRKADREVVRELVLAGKDVAVYGADWTPDLLDPVHVRGTFVPNEDLAAYYAAATIVLNDHWPDMARGGFLSNRLYDAAASGAFVVSDRVEGIDAEFDAGVATYGSPAELVDLVERALASPQLRADAAARARSAVLARHTFGHRADAFVDLVLPLLEGRAGRGRALGAGPLSPTEIER
jgi:O-antigen biosynthesis protein